MGSIGYILSAPAACSRTFSSFCLLLPATAHFKLPFGPSDAVRATSSTTNWPVNPEAPKITRWYGLLEDVSTRAIVTADKLAQTPAALAPGSWIQSDSLADCVRFYGAPWSTSVAG